MSMLRQGIQNRVTDHAEYVAEYFGLNDVAAWKLVAGTATASLSLVWTYNFVFQDESLYVRGKKTVFRLVRKVPAVQRLIAKQKKETMEGMVEDLNKEGKHIPIRKTLPESSFSSEEVLREAGELFSLGSYDWNKGCLSGAVYNASPDLNDLLTKVFEKSAFSNPLHPDVFPGVRRMEAEVVAMTAALFHGGPDACGTMTSGGTESIILACKAYRDYARETKGISRPEILVPVTAHAAFDKAADLLNIKIVHVPVDPVTLQVNVNAMRRAITRRTAMLVCSAPGFPYGILDPVAEVAALGERHKIPVHVDACLGGFLIPFMSEAGFPLPAFDFSLPGVTSISADTHKYGFAPKGSSVILYSHPRYRSCQFFVTPDWTGGIYASPTIAGSRPGSTISTCWASMMYYGKQGYVDATRKIITTTRRIEQGLRQIPHINVIGKPQVSVVAVASKEFNIYRLSDGMAKLGWNLNALQFPSSIHLCVTYLHTQPGVADRFLQNVREVVGEIMKDPKADVGGAAAIYGMAQSIPDRSMVAEMACCFLDAMYTLQGESSTAEEKKVNA
nr:EOG090X051L [Triops cancriformis]